MKLTVGITVDDVKVTKYVLGKYDFYTRQVELPRDVAHKISIIQELADTAQRILRDLYDSNGRIVSANDLEEFECLDLSPAEEATPARKPARKRKQQASEADSSLES